MTPAILSFAMSVASDLTAATLGGLVGAAGGVLIAKRQRAKEKREGLVRGDHGSYSRTFYTKTDTINPVTGNYFVEQEAYTLMHHVHIEQVFCSPLNQHLTKIFMAAAKRCHSERAVVMFPLLKTDPDEEAPGMGATLWRRMARRPATKLDDKGLNIAAKAWRRFFSAHDNDKTFMSTVDFPLGAQTVKTSFVPLLVYEEDMEDEEQFSFVHFSREMMEDGYFPDPRDLLVKGRPAGPKDLGRLNTHLEAVKTMRENPWIWDMFGVNVLTRVRPVVPAPAAA